MFSHPLRCQCSIKMETGEAQGMFARGCVSPMGRDGYRKCLCTFRPMVEFSDGGRWIMTFMSSLVSISL